MRPFFIGAAPGRGTINLSKGRTRHLSPRERRFLEHWLGEGMTQVDAYLEASKRPDGSYPCSRGTAYVNASKMVKRLRSYPAQFQAILASAGLDDYAFAGHLNRMLRATRTEFYQGKPVAECEDNTTQMRATELLADILGHRKNAVELSGSLGLKGYIGVSPDDWDKPAGTEDLVPDPEQPPEPQAASRPADPADPDPPAAPQELAAPTPEPEPRRGFSIKYLDGREVHTDG